MIWSEKSESENERRKQDEIDELITTNSLLILNKLNDLELISMEKQNNLRQRGKENIQKIKLST
jgi:hypothetical protein